MRFLAYIVLLIALGAAGLAGEKLWREWQARGEREPIRTARLQQPEAQPPTPPNSSRQWPALFGEPQPPAPPKPPEKVEKEEPLPPPKQFPPLASMGFTLTGVVQANGTVWAMVSHPTGEQVMREGDELKEGLIVTRIDDGGLWAMPDGGEEMLLEFPE